MLVGYIKKYSKFRGLYLNAKQTKKNHQNNTFCWDSKYKYIVILRYFPTPK